MKLNQNIILVVLVCILLSVLFSIEVANVLSIPKEVKKVINQNKNNTQRLNFKQKKLSKIKFNAGKNKHL